MILGVGSTEGRDSTTVEVLGDNHNGSTVSINNLARLQEVICNIEIMMN